MNLKKPDPLLADIVATQEISTIMEDIGYGCCENPATFKEILNQFPEMKEQDVAKMLGMMIRTQNTLEGQGVSLYKDFPPTTDFTVTDKAEQSAKSWNINTVVDVLKEMVRWLPHVLVWVDFCFTRAHAHTTR